MIVTKTRLRKSRVTVSSVNGLHLYEFGSKMVFGSETAAGLLFIYFFLFLLILTRSLDDHG